ncbi:MAG: universal stress protein [Comamonadaceae bacterium]|nr:MAG: universal stress protein [Comamonadaceae bacterium]
MGLMDRRLIRTLQASDASAPGMQTLTQLAHNRSRETLEAALVRAGLRPDQGSVQVGATAVRLLEQQVRIGASVLVVGRRSQPGWMDRLWPGLARPLMDRAPCDVLVLPERVATAKDARWALAHGRRERAASEGP